MYHPRVEELPDEDSVPKVKSVSWANAAPTRRVVCEDDSGDMADSDGASVSDEVDVKLEDIFPKGIDWSTRVDRSMSVVAAGSNSNSSRSGSVSSADSAPGYLDKEEDEDRSVVVATSGGKAEGDETTTTVSVAKCWKRQFDPSRVSSETAKKLLNWGSICVHNVPCVSFAGSVLSRPMKDEVKESGVPGAPLMLSWKGNDGRPLGENIRGIKHGRRPVVGAEYRSSYRISGRSLTGASSTLLPKLGRALDQDEDASTALVDALQELSLGSSQDQVTTHRTAAPLFWRNEQLTKIGTTQESSCPRLVAPGDPRVEYEMGLMRENLEREHNMRQALRRKEGSFDHQVHNDDSPYPELEEFQLDVNSATKRTRIDVVDRGCDKVATPKPASPTAVGATGQSTHRHIPSKRGR